MVLLKLALRPWRRAFGLQLLVCASISVLSFGGTLAFWLTRQAGPMIDALGSENVVTVYFAAEATDEDRSAVRDAIRLNLGASAARAQFAEQSSGEFLEELKRQEPELAHRILGLTSEPKRLVPSTLSVRGHLEPELVDLARGLPGVEAAESTHGRFRSLGEFLRGLRRGLPVLGALLFLGALGLLTQSARWGKSLLGDAHAILESLGASRWRAALPARAYSLSVAAVAGGAAVLWMAALHFRLWSKLAPLSPLTESVSPPSLLWVILPLPIALTISVLASLGRPERG